MVNAGLVVTNPEPTAMRDSFLFLRATLLRKIRQECREFPEIIDRLDRLEAGTLEIPSVPGLLAEIQKTGLLVEYKSLKTLLDSFRPKLVMNRAEEFNEGLEAARRMRDEARRELGIDIAYLGPIMADPCVVRAVKESAPFLRRFPESDAAHWIRNLAQRVEENSDFEIERNYFSFGSYLKRLFGGAKAQ
jgi:MinD-like ATPase involved in chromosome partitioning or flagellar assembly